MTLRLGILGLSPGNGHPYSWSAICNGYNVQEMADCGFPAIPEYLSRQSWPGDKLEGVRVTHIWTQDFSLSQKIARASLIEHVVNDPCDMIDSVDGILLARDDAQNHAQFARAFLQAGMPVYIDKPVALSEVEFEKLHSLQKRPGQIFSCSALRYAPELRLDQNASSKIGQIRLVQGVTPKYWETYSIHLIDPLLAILGHEIAPEFLFSDSVGADGRFLALRWPIGGPDVHLMATGGLPSPLHIRVVGDGGEVTLAFTDSFSAFKNALAAFVESILSDGVIQTESLNRRAVQIIEMGMP